MLAFKRLVSFCGPPRNISGGRFLIVRVGFQKFVQITTQFFTKGLSGDGGIKWVFMGEWVKIFVLLF